MSKMKLVSEEQILDEEFRRKVIDEIVGTENINRKNMALRSHEVYRDKTLKWVIEGLQKEDLDPTTIQAMENRGANISICRKIVNKLARCYTGGVSRSVKSGETESQEDTQKIDEMSHLLEFDKKMKKADRYRQLFKNCAIQVVPEIDSRASRDIDDPARMKRKLKMRVFPPWNYDVIEDSIDQEVPRVFILSEFTERNEPRVNLGETGDGRTPGGIVGKFHAGDKRDQIIADKPEDEGFDDREFIWWSDRYHFTTNRAGEILQDKSPESNENPIQMLPFANIAEDQDGSFWAEGGDDLVDMSVLINTTITDAMSILYIQGWGQTVVSGPKGSIPKKLEGGPHRALIFETNPGDDKNASVQILSSNPPIADWIRLVEQLVALLLSTNDLSPGNISGTLDPNNFASGIARLIEMSEFVGSIEDKQKMFVDIEREIWQIIQKWQNFLFEKDALNDKFKEIQTIQNSDVLLDFVQQRPPVTEEEKLRTIKMRKDLGISTEIELLKIDNPNLSDEQAEEKLKQIKAEKLKRMNDIMRDQFTPGDGDEEDEGDAGTPSDDEQESAEEDLDLNEGQ